MTERVWLYIAVMALVTYAIRLFPLVLLRREIRNVRFRSFLYYVPYATLTAMTLPAALFVTPHLAFASAESMVARAKIVFDNIDAFLSGEQRNIVL